MGFALACDFLKENGYPEFAKPDVHIKKIFNGLGLSDSNDDYEVFKDVIRVSELVNGLPYRVDKLFWLVGSGISIWMVFEFSLIVTNLYPEPKWIYCKTLIIKGALKRLKLTRNFLNPPNKFESEGC